MKQRKRKSLIDEVEEMAKRAAEKKKADGKIEKTEIAEYKPKDIAYKVRCGGWLSVRDSDGNVIGTLKNNSVIVGRCEGDKIHFKFEGRDGYISVDNVV